MADLKSLLRNLPTQHYYGDVVRALFLAGGALMLLSLPFVNNFVPVPYFVSILLIVAIAILAGVTNPKQKAVNIIDVGVSAVAFVVFEFYAIQSLSRLNSFTFFLVNQILAVIFFVALYYSTKTLRGRYLKEDQQSL